jgi:hypothetical protein
VLEINEDQNASNPLLEMRKKSLKLEKKVVLFEICESRQENKVKEDLKKIEI